MRQRGRAIALVFVTSLFATASLVAVAAPAGAQTLPGSDCNATEFRWLFWSKGHGKVKSQDFPAFKTPHLEVYKDKGKKFLDDDSVAYADPTQAATSTEKCTAAEIPTGSEGTITKTTKKTKQLVCTFDSSPLFFSSPATTGGYALIAYVDGKSAVAATLAETGSKLQFDGDACKLKKVPK